MYIEAKRTMEKSNGRKIKIKVSIWKIFDICSFFSFYSFPFPLTLFPSSSTSSTSISAKVISTDNVEAVCWNFDRQSLLQKFVSDIPYSFDLVPFQKALTLILVVCSDGCTSVSIVFYNEKPTSAEDIYTSIHYTLKPAKTIRQHIVFDTMRIKSMHLSVTLNFLTQQ